MKYYLFLLSIVLLGSCNNERKNTPGEAKDYDLYLRKIDSCEYVVWIGYSKGGIVHSGNCHNPKHLNQ